MFEHKSFKLRNCHIWIDSIADSQIILLYQKFGFIFDKWEDNIWLTISFHNEWLFICIKKIFSFSSKQNGVVRNAIFYSQFNNLSLIYITICIKLSLTLQNMINRSFVRCKTMNILIFSIAWNIIFLWNVVMFKTIFKWLAVDFLVEKPISFRLFTLHWF